MVHGDKYKWSLRFITVNLTNKVALYNFLSTFGGTRYVSPRSYTAQLGFGRWGWRPARGKPAAVWLPRS